MHYEKKINGPCAQSIMLLVKNLLNYHQVDEYGTAWDPKLRFKHWNACSYTKQSPRYSLYF